MTILKSFLVLFFLLISIYLLWYSFNLPLIIEAEWQALVDFRAKFLILGLAFGILAYGLVKQKKWSLCIYNILLAFWFYYLFFPISELPFWGQQKPGFWKDILVLVLAIGIPTLLDYLLYVALFKKTCNASDVNLKDEKRCIR
ncbi:MAG: hypothetical protein CR997_13905 [Acidobacteria bacterium]|nr:MAG: hypothetical protein CR997_13905 [Acidobacteriota bacterium]